MRRVVAKSFYMGVPHSNGIYIARCFS